MRGLFSKLNRPALAAFVSVLALAGLATAGSLTPSALPASTMHSLEELYDSIAGVFDSSAIVSSSSGSLIEHLKYIEENMSTGPSFWASTSADIYNTNSGNVGIGTVSPGTSLSFGQVLDVVGTSTAIRALGTNGPAYFIAESWEPVPPSPHFEGRFGNGSYATPQAVGSGETLVRFVGRGYDGSGFDNINAEIRFVTAEAFTPLAQGTMMEFRTNAIGDTGAQTRMAIDAAGNVGIGTTTPGAILNIESAASGPGLRLLQLHKSDLGDGEDVYLKLGKAQALRDEADISYYHDGDGSTLNALNFGFNGVGSLATLLANGNFGIASSSPMVRLAVDGDAIVSGSAAFGMGRINQSILLSGILTIGTVFEYLASPLYDDDLNDQYGTLTTFGVPADAAYDDTVNIIGQGVSVYAPDTLTAGGSPARLLGLDVVASYEGDEFIGGLHGIDVQVARGGVTGDTDFLRGLRVSVDNEGGGMVENVNGLEVHMNSSGVNANNLTAAHFTYYDNYANNATGLYIQNVGDGSNSSYTLYAAGTNTLNYFEGNVGIASSSPDETLTVAGTTLVRGHAAIGNIALVDDPLGYDSGFGLDAAASLVVREEYTDLVTPVVAYGIAADLVLNPSADPTAFPAAITAQVLTADDNIRDFSGIGITGGSFYVRHDADGDVNSITGIQATAQNNSPTGTVTDLYGTRSNIYVSSAGSVTNAYSFYGGVPFSGAPVTNLYGLYLESSNITGPTNTWNIYSDGSGTRNFFEGNVGIGSSSAEVPASRLVINRTPRPNGFVSGSGLTPTLLAAQITARSVPTTGSVFQTIWDLPAGGGGVTNIAFLNQTASTSSQNMTGSLIGATALGEHVGTGTATTVVGLQGGAQNRNTGTITTAQGVVGQFGSFAAGTTTNAYGVYGQASSITTGTIVSAYNVFSGRPSFFSGGTVVGHAGLATQHLTQATNNTGLLIASTSSGLNVPAGNFGIWNGSPYVNYFAGNVGIGDATPIYKLAVNGTASVSGLANLGAGASVSGGLIPTADNTYDLGSSALRWRSLYVASASIHIGMAGNEAVISYDSSGPDDFLSLNGLHIFDSGDASLSGSFEMSGGTQFTLPSDENFVIDASSNERQTGLGALRILHTAGMANTRAMNIVQDMNGYSDTRAISIDYTATGLDAGSTVPLIALNVDTADSTGGVIQGLSFSKVGTGTAVVEALDTYAGIIPISQHVSGPGAPDQGWKASGASFTDTTTAFSSSGTNVTLFNADNDYIYVGHASPFSMISVVLATGASNNITPVFEYSLGGGSWQTFGPGDNTNGFRVSGGIELEPEIMTGWATDTVNGVGSMYWVRIQRTRNTLGTVPTERTIWVQGTTEYEWDEHGNLNVYGGSFSNLLTVASQSDTNVLRLQDADGTCNHNPEAGSETVTCSSDERLKADIQDAPSVLAWLGGFRIRSYTVRASGDRMTGVIAQELRETNPELVSMGPDGLLMVQQPSQWELVKAIQELSGRIDSLALGGPLTFDDSSVIDRLMEFLEGAVLRVRALVADTVETQDGITTYDHETGEPYCMRVSGGEVVAEPGKCGAATDDESSGDGGEPADEGGPGTEEPTPEPTQDPAGEAGDEASDTEPPPETEGETETDSAPEPEPEPEPAPEAPDENGSSDEPLE